jgi:hypothetical protein
MSSDNQYTALGPAAIGFQTNASKIDVGAEITGSIVGIRGRCSDGNGIEGTSGRATGVSGSGDLGVFGAGRSNGVMGVNQGADGSGVFGVHTSGVNLDTPVTPHVHPKLPVPGAGVYGFSDGGDGVVGESIQGYGANLTGGRAPLRLTPSKTEKGHPLTGFHQQGELFVNAAGQLWFCTHDGTPGTWKQVNLI